MDKLMPLSSATAVIGETAGPLNPKSAVPVRPGSLKMQHQPSIVAPSSSASASGPTVASPAKSDQRPVQKNVNPVIERNVSFIETKTKPAQAGTKLSGIFKGVVATFNFNGRCFRICLLTCCCFI